LNSFLPAMFWMFFLLMETLKLVRRDGDIVLAPIWIAERLKGDSLSRFRVTIEGTASSSIKLET
jgi:hypothetical protein